MIHLPEMYKLTVMNMTSASLDRTEPVLRAALILEWFLIILNFGETMITWHLLRYTNQYHRNLAMIVEQLANQYVFSLLARMWIIYKQLTISDTAELLEDRTFLFALWLRNSLLFVAFYFAPFPVLERCFAVIYMNDYETNQRRWISYFLSGLLYLIALTSAQFFIFQQFAREFHIYLISAFNLSAFALTFVMEKANAKKYSDMRNNMNVHYSLSARAQLSENVSSMMPFKVMSFSIATFAIVSTMLLHVDEYTDSQNIKNWVYVAFNYSCWCYGTAVPLSMLAYNGQWKKVLGKWKQRLCYKKNRISSEHTSQTTRVKDTFGNNCFVDDKQHTDVYFSQLKSDWN